MTRSKRYPFDTDDPAFQNFINTLQTEATKELYTWGLNHYAKFSKVKKYSDLLFENDGKKCEVNMIQYVQSLNKDNASNAKKNAYLAVLKHFYSINDMDDINWWKVKKNVKRSDKKRSQRMYSRDELYRIVKAIPLRLKVIVLLMATAGLRAGAIPELKIKDLKMVENTFLIIVYAGTTSQYPTFCSAKCADAIREYLAERRRKGEQLDGESRLIAGDVAPELQVNMDTIRNALTYWLKKLEIRQTGNKMERQEVMIFHGFRKWFDTQMNNSRIDSRFKELMMGHSEDELDKSYWDVNNPETVREILIEYKKAEKNLTV
jgi:integrase